MPPPRPGFDAIPVPPTFPFVMQTWGEFAEDQPADKPKGNPMGEVIGPLMAKGGIILHGEQEFIYHRPVVVGDVLVGEGTRHRRLRQGVQGQDDDLPRHRDGVARRDDVEPVVTSRFNLIHRG